MKRIKIIVLIIAAVIFSACNNNDDKLSRRDLSIINDAIEDMANKEMRLKEGFLVNPYFSSFGFNKYFIERGFFKDDNKLKKKLFEENGWNDETFKVHQSEINGKYSNRKYDELLNLSNSDVSNWVVTFSAIDDNIAFMELIRYCDEITKEDLINKSIADNPYKAEVHSLIVKVENNKFKEILIENTSHTEKCIEARE